MRRSKTRRVSWATDANLCQVRLFLYDEAPSQVGLGIQDHLQAKTLSNLHAASTPSEDNLPPGFEGVQPSNHLFLEVPTIRWKRPPKLIMKLSWHVAVGEESQEVEAENHRGMRVFEAIYPRPSSIPPNAVVSAEVTETQSAHQQPPFIPITPIEEEDIVVDPLYDNYTEYQAEVTASGGFSMPMYVSQSAASTSSSDRPVCATPPGVEPDVLAAASAAHNAIMKTNEQGNLIDPELLVQILTDRTLVEKLTKSYYGKDLLAPQQSCPPVNLSNPPSAQNSWPISSPSGPFFSQPNNVSLPLKQGPHLAPTLSSRDFNYYKTLIQQHGEDRQEMPQQFGTHPISHYGKNQDHSLNNPRYRDYSKPKMIRPCMFFNTPRGCKNGVNCSFQHDVPVQQRISSTPDAKRMKIDKDIPGG